MILMGEDGFRVAFGVPSVPAVRRRAASKGGDHKNIFTTTVADGYAPAARSPAHPRSGATQPIDFKHTSPLQTRCHLPSLSRSGVFRVRTGTRSWRDRDVQQPKSFVWSPMRLANRLCLRRRSPIHASSIWSGCWHDRPHGTSFKPKQTAGRETASRIKEVAS